VLRPPHEPEEQASARSFAARDDRARSARSLRLRDRSLPFDLPRSNEGLGSRVPRSLQRRLAGGTHGGAGGAVAPAEQRCGARAWRAAGFRRGAARRGGRSALIMGLVFASSPILVVTFGALLLMLAEAFSKKTLQNDLALGTAVVLFAGAAMSIAVWMVGPETLDGARSLAPYLLADRFSMFLSF